MVVRQVTLFRYVPDYKDENESGTAMGQNILEMDRSRADILARLQLLDSPPEHDFDLLTAMAMRTLGAKISLLSLVDADRLWFKAKCGLDLLSIPRQNSLCSVALDTDEALVVSDARLDPMFANSPAVIGPPNIRFYAGIPVRAVSAEGERVSIGTICVIDDKPRSMTAGELDTLRDFARLAEVLIEARASALKASDFAQESHGIAVVLGREQQQFKQAERMAQMGSWRLSLPENVLTWSEGVFAIHELPMNAPVPVETAFEFYPKPDRDIVAAALAETIATGHRFELETDFITAQGNPRRVRLMGELEWDGERLAGVIGVFQDITETHLLGQELLRLSRTDELTQMANRAEFNRVLDGAIVEAHAKDRRLAVLLIDLDGFKSVNDRFGHAVGDDLLRRIAEVFKAPYLANCLAARLGGDEFAIIFSNPSDLDAIDRIVQQLLCGLRMMVEHEHSVLPVSGTVGIAWLGSEPIGRSELLRQADVALYSAKRRQRGTAETYQAGHRLLSA